MMTNPMAQILNLARTGGNPQQLLMQMAASDPRAAQAMQIINGKTPEQLKQIATNMCRERGTTPEQLIQSFGLE